MNKNILIVISLLCMDKLISSTYPIIGGVNHKATCLQLLERELQKPNIVPASRRVIEKTKGISESVA